MPISVRTTGNTSVVELSGHVDSSIASDTEAQVLQHVRVGTNVTFEMSNLVSLSALGVRRVLMLYRKLVALGAQVTLTGASPVIKDMMRDIGFNQIAPPVHIEYEQNGQQPFDWYSPRARIDLYPTQQSNGFAIRPGRVFPFGAWPIPGGVNFSVFSSHATKCTLVLFERDAPKPFVEIPVPNEFRIGQVYAMTVFGVDPEQIEYGYRFDGPNDPAKGHYFDPTKILLDPFARAVGGRDVWGALPKGDEAYANRARLVPDDFEWEGDRPLELPIEDLVVYEMHVRGFTQSPSSGVRTPGTFSAIREKIPYLKELGVNCVELMPIFEFDECEHHRHHPETGESLLNYWGYSPFAFYAPKASFAATGQLGMQVDEFKALVKDLHRAGIEVILDVVFNHTAEGNEKGPTISFRGIDNQTYYMLGGDGHYMNFSGCGNTLNCNHPMVRDLVLNCLRYWVSECHVDGFRFDLASILGRDSNGAPLHNPPLLEALAKDFLLSKTKLIAEAWDAGGLYQVGSFPAYHRWAEWNGKFRDGIRKFIKSEEGMVPDMAQRLCGSPDLYHGRGPSASINFVTCHDGFTLHDLVSYNDKHNEGNGEQNRDGANDNYTWNCGAEGPTDDPEIMVMRRRQVRNALTLLFVSQGVPMLYMGDECGRTQDGNNNAYCMDNPTNWLDWSKLREHEDLFRFCRLLIAFRKQHPALRHRGHPGEPTAQGLLNVRWHGLNRNQPDWSAPSRVLAVELLGNYHEYGPDILYIAMNMHWEPHGFELPAAPAGQQWHVFVNTGMPAPEDIFETGREPIVSETWVMLAPRSVMVLLARSA